jgi:hypothetical protein
MLAPNPVKTYPFVDSVLAAFSEWRRKRGKMRESRQRLDQCDAHEVARIARDVGLSSHELQDMVKRGPDAAKLLLRRMAALHLSPDVVTKSEPAVMRDLQRLCSMCASKKRCQRALASNPDDPVWRRYCPNVGTLVALQEDTAVVR